MIIRNNIHIKGDNYTIRLYGYDEIWKYKPEKLPSLKDNGICEYDVELYNQYKNKLSVYNKRFFNREYQDWEKKKNTYVNNIGTIAFVLCFISFIIIVFVPANILDGYSTNNNTARFLGAFHLLMVFPYLFLLIKIAKKIKDKLYSSYLEKNPPIYKEPAIPKNHDKVEQYLSSLKSIKHHNLLKSEQVQKCKWNDYGAESFDDFFNVYPSLIGIGVSYLIEKLSSQEKKSNPEWWYQLNPVDFEIMIAQWFKDQGYKTTVTPPTNDGGYDVIIEKDRYKGLVQCKRYTSSKVSASTVRELNGVVIDKKADQGIIVSLKGCTKEALLFMDRNNMAHYTLKDYQGYYAQIHRKDIDAKITKHNDNWIKIGPYYFLTSIFCTFKDAEQYIAKLTSESGYSYKIWQDSHCFILYGKEPDFKYLRTLL